MAYASSTFIVVVPNTYLIGTLYLIGTYIQQAQHHIMACQKPSAVATGAKTASFAPKRHTCGTCSKAASQRLHARHNSVRKSQNVQHCNKHPGSLPACPPFKPLAMGRGRRLGPPSQKLRDDARRTHKTTARHGTASSSFVGNPPSGCRQCAPPVGQPSSTTVVLHS